MKYNPQKHHRRSIRLQNYDYTRPGAYFITMCTPYKWDYLFGDVEDGEMHCNNYGKIAAECWNDISQHFPHVELDAFTAMPNHFQWDIGDCQWCRRRGP